MRHDTNYYPTKHCKCVCDANQLFKSQNNEQLTYKQFKNQEMKKNFHLLIIAAIALLTGLILTGCGLHTFQTSGPHRQNAHLTHSPRFAKGDKVQIKGERRYIYTIDSISHYLPGHVFYHGTEITYGWVQPFLPEKSIKLWK